MAKRNQVTVNLRIAADAQLKNSQSFIKQLEKVTNQFDFGDKINSQLEKAKSQLKSYNKIFEKVQDKSFISDDELKALVKAGKEVEKIIKNTESIHGDKNLSELQKYSKSYIAEIKKQEAEIAKIKSDYNKQTGKNYDKEIANYDKMVAKNKELYEQRQKIKNDGVEKIVAQQIENTNKKLDQQKQKLEEIKNLKEKSSQAYKKTLNTEASNRGYDNYDQLKNTKVLNENQIRKNIGNAIYKQQRQELNEINKELKNIENQKEDNNNQDIKAIALAEKHNIANVKGVETLKQQLKIRKDLLNTYKNDKSKLSLQNEQLVTNELQKQKQILEDKKAVEDAAKRSELKVIQEGGYNSKASLSASYSATNKSVMNLSNQLTESGIENLTTAATNQLNATLQKIDADINKSNANLKPLDEAAKRIATNSELQAKSDDVQKVAPSIENGVENGLSNAEKNINSYTDNSNGDVISVLGTKIDQKDIQDKTDNIKSNILQITNPEFDEESLQASNIQLQNQVDNLLYDLKQISLGNKEYISSYKKHLAEVDGNFDEIEKQFENEIQFRRRMTDEEEREAKEALENAKKKNNIQQHMKAKKDLEVIQKRRVNEEGNFAQAKSNLKSLRESFLDTNDIIGLTDNSNNKLWQNVLESAQKGSAGISKAAQEVQYMGHMVDDLKGKVGYFLSANFIFDQAIRKIREASTFTKELDKDMTQIGLVLGKTANQTWKNFNTYSQMATRLSTTTSEVTAAMKLFYQQGLNTVEVNKMVEASAIAAALGESTMAEASETLTSIVNSYGLAASQAIDVTDKISQVAIVSAADFGELSVAIEKVASSAASAGLDLDHMMGYLAKMVETTREAPTNIGTALKTIVANFAQFKEDPNATNEDGNDVNKVDAALKSVGIQLLDATGEMRDLGEVIDELGIKWKGLSRNTKAYLATMIAGTRQQSRFYALMNDYDRTLELVNESTRSEGKSTQQFALYQQSLTASTQRLNNEWEKFYNGTLKNDNVLRTLNNSLAGLLKLANKIGPVMTLIFGIGTTKGIRGALNQLTRFKAELENTHQQLISTVNLGNNIRSGQNIIPDMNFISTKEKSGKDSNPFNKLANSQAKKRFEKLGGNEQAESFKKLMGVTEALKNKDLELLKTEEDLLKTFISKEEVANVLKGTISDSTIKIAEETATEQLSVVQHTAGAAVKWAETAAQVALNLAVMAAVALVGAAIVGIVKLVNAEHERTLALQEEAKAARDNYEELEELTKSYLELSEKINLTTEDKEALEQATQNLLEQYPDLISYIDSEGKAYAKTNEEIKKYLKNKEKETIAKEKNAAIQTLNDGKFKTNAIWDGALFNTVYKEDDEKMFGERQKSARDDLFNAFKNMESSGVNGGYGKAITNKNGDITNSTLQHLIKEEDYVAVENWLNKTKKDAEQELERLKKLPSRNISEEDRGRQIEEQQNRINSITEMDQSVKRYNKAVKEDLADLAQKIYDKTISEADLDDTKESLTKNVLKQKTDEALKNKENNEISEYLQSEEYTKLQNNVVNEIKGLSDANALAIEQFMTTINSDTSSTFEQIKNKAEELKKSAPSTAGILEDSLKIYEETINKMVEGTPNAEGKKANLSKLKTGTLNALANAKNNMQGDTSEGFNEQEFNNIYTKILDNEQFLNALNNLDTTNLGAIQEFKQKYANSLGQYGMDFLNEIIKNPKYDAEKTQSELTTAQTGMTSQNSNGVSFNDISTGSVSQEDALNELTNTEENARRNITLVGKDLIVTGKEIVDSFEKSQKDAIKSLNSVITNARDNIKKYQEQLKDWDKTGFENLTDEQKEQYKQTQKNIMAERNRIDNAQDLVKAYKKVSITEQAVKDNKDVITGFSAVKKEVDALKDLADMYQYVGSARMSQLDIIDAVAQNTDLLTALEVNEQGQLYLTKAGIEEVAAARIGDAKATVDAQIAKLTALESMVDGEATYTEFELKVLEEMATQWSNLSKDQQTSLMEQAKAAGVNVQSMDDWAKFVKKDINGAIEAWNKYYAAARDESQGTVNEGGSGGTVTVGGVSVSGTSTKVDGGDAKGKIQAQINRLKSVSKLLAGYQKSPGKLLGDINKMGDYASGGGGGGSKDKFDAMVEKLERFYNYLRQIEALEAKINKIREKRNLIDATQNYYIKDLAEENRLLKEQASLYNNYINDEVSYLANLRSQLAATYGDWVYFNDEGVVQVKQTEFNINSEAEQERYEAFSELLDEYQNEYNTMLENQNKLYSIQATIVENINSAYDKTLQKLNDVTERLEYINSISEHKVNMEFGSIKKLEIMNEQIKTTADMLLNAQKSVNELEGDFNQLSKIVQESAFKSLLTWDETLQKYFVNNDALNDENVRKQFEAQGYNWQEIVTWVNATAGASQKVTDSMKEANEQLMSARESLKGLLDERISTIDEIFDKATEEINKFYDIYEKKIASLETENDLFGTKSENLEKQFDYLVTTAQHAKALLNDLKENNQSILNTLMKDYGQYVEMIDGVAYINKVAIEESNTLTEGQKADLLQLYQLYYDSKDQIDEVNDKFYDYISQIKEMEETKRDAIIDLKNQLYQELLRIDQKEIDDLSEKYQKMSQLDSEYYSKLQQRINDARNARSRLQEQQNLTQTQNRLATLQQDNSGQYNSEMIELQKQINEQLQAQADQEIDLELERIAREQQQRQEDREMQITQMENLLTFKDENGVYWEMTQDIIESGNASVIGKLMESEEIQRLSKEEQAKQFESLESQVEMANADFTSIYQEEVGWQTNNITQSLKDFVGAPLDKIPGEISSSAGQIKEQIVNGTKTFINTMSALFKYLDELTGKTEAKGYTTGILNDSGIYTAPTKKPDPAPRVPTAPAAPPQSRPSLAKGSYVQVKSGTRWYYDSYGKNPSGRARSGTIKYVNTRGTHPYNIEGLGWIKKTDIVGYNKGGYVDYTGIAAVHGKAGKPEAFLNAKQTALFETLRDALAKVPTIRTKEDNSSNENITIENFTIDVKELADTDSIDKVVKTVKDSIYRDATSGNNMKINRRR